MPFITQTFLVQKEQKAFLWLMRTFGYSQKEAQKILDKGWLSQRGRGVTKAECICAEVELLHFVPQRLFLKKLLLTPSFVVYDKPPELLTHPRNTQGGLSVCDELKSEFGREANPAHRLDALTSGILVCSINKKKEGNLKGLFERGEVKKTYRALIKGELKEEILIDAPILSPKAEGKFIDLKIRSMISPKGKSAQTLIRPLCINNGVSLIEAYPLTGRTHQIRLHLAYLGMPILGDPLYGCDDVYSRKFLDTALCMQKRKEYFGMERLALHASRIEFEFEGEKIVVESEPTFQDPSSFDTNLSNLREY